MLLKVHPVMGGVKYGRKNVDATGCETQSSFFSGSDKKRNHFNYDRNQAVLGASCM